ncbi:hypothetical protein CW368_08900 [Actinomycetales bacterium SN12]|nr:hypothetical protein CW368_08900 [Actinomycetales bacterium SN12]
MPNAEAVMALRVVEDVRERVSGVPRRHAVMQLLYAVMVSAYMAVFVYTGSAEGDADRSGGTTMALLLPPLVLSSALVEGAAQRFGGRLRAARRYWMAAVAFGVMLVIFLLWSVIGGGYPWWLSLVSLFATLVVFGARPVGVLLRGGAEAARATVSAPLPRGSRVTTVVIGLVFGAICATLFLPVAVWGTMMASMVLMLISAGATSTWGLRSTGWYWGTTQWCAFGISTGAMFLLAALTIATELISPVVSASTGAVIAASVVVTAFLPGRGDDGYDGEGADGASEA